MTAPDPSSAGTIGLIQGGNPPEYASGRDLHTRMHINQLKAAWGWTAPEKDANGYPTKLGENDVSSLILRAAPQLSGVAPYTGRFRLYGQGTGRIHIGWTDILKRTATARLPRETIGGVEYWYVDFDYDPLKFKGPVHLEIVDLPIPGDHLRDMALVHHSHLDAWREGETFMPEVLVELSQFGHVQAAGGAGRGTLRMMQSLQSNHLWAPGETTYLTQTDAQRERRFVGPDYYSFVRIQHDPGGRPHKLVPTVMPIEDIVALVNATGTNLWYNLSADIMDSRARVIAEYVRDHLDPSLTVYWEYGNELWNGARGFDAYTYAVAQGQAKFPGLDKTRAVYEWDVYRSMQLYSQIRDVFSDQPERSRYVAAFWGYNASNRLDGSIVKDSYAARYFAASRARQEPDIGAFPEDIITDMAVGGYFGSPSDEVADYIAASYPDDRSRAEALARMVMMGMDGDMIELDRANLRRPVRDVAPDTPIGAYALIRGDVADGLDALRSLDQVLRIEGRELQYRGTASRRWRPVLEFSEDPDRTVSDMVAEVQLMGYGSRFFGKHRNGFNGQIRNSLTHRVHEHRAFAERYGLDFHFYEGGVGSDGAPGSDKQITGAFMREYHMGGWAAEVMRAFLERAAPDVTQMVWYKSHDRTYRSGYRGLKEYYGQPVEETPKWQLIETLVSAGPAAEAPVQ